MRNSASFRVHKRLLYHTCENPEAFLRPVTAELEAFEAELMREQAELEEEVLRLYVAGDAGGARDLLTRTAEDWFLQALSLGESLVAVVEAETRERFGIRMPAADPADGISWRPESQEMTLRPGRLHLRCYVAGLNEYPRSHGNYEDERILPDQAGSEGGSLR